MTDYTNVRDLLATQPAEGLATILEVLAGFTRIVAHLRANIQWRPLTLQLSDRTFNSERANRQWTIYHYSKKLSYAEDMGAIRRSSVNSAVTLVLSKVPLRNAFWLNRLRSVKRRLSLIPHKECSTFFELCRFSCYDPAAIEYGCKNRRLSLAKIAHLLQKSQRRGFSTVPVVDLRRNSARRILRRVTSFRRLIHKKVSLTRRMCYHGDGHVGSF